MHLAGSSESGVVLQPRTGAKDMVSSQAYPPTFGNTVARLHAQAARTVSD